MSALEARGLTRKVGRRTLLDKVSARFEAGGISAILGPNGAGKSTLLTALAGLTLPEAGAVHLDGQPLLALSPTSRARRIGFLAQMPEIAWAVTARTYIGLGRIPHMRSGGPSRTDEAAVDRAMDLTGTADMAARIVTTLSGGELARVLIARALSGEPEWLLADEPLAGLDPGHQLDMTALLRRLADGGMGVILTLHDLTLAARIADHAVILQDGRIAAQGPPDQALTDAAIASAYGISVARLAGPAGQVLDVVGRI